MPGVPFRNATLPSAARPITSVLLMICSMFARSIRSGMAIRRAQPRARAPPPPRASAFPRIEGVVARGRTIENERWVQRARLAWRELFEQAESRGGLTDMVYLEALARRRRWARDEGIDATLAR